MVPSGNQTWQWKISHLHIEMNFPLNPPFIRDFPLKSLIAKAYLYVNITNSVCKGVISEVSYNGVTPKLYIKVNLDSYKSPKSPMFRGSMTTFPLVPRRDCGRRNRNRRGGSDPETPYHARAEEDPILRWWREVPVMFVDNIYPPVN